VGAALAGTLLAPLALAAAEGTITVPLEIRGNFPVVTARIDGRELPLMFDLGGDFDLVLTEPALAMVRTTPLEGSYQFSDVKGNIIEAPLFRVAQVDVGGVVFADVTGHADRSDPSYRRTDIGDMGILGQPFFRSKKIVLDYAQRRLTIIPGDSPDAEAGGCRGTPVQFLPEWRGAPVTKVVTDAGELTMVWDTGAPISIIRRQRVLDAHVKIVDDRFASERFMLSGTDFGPLELRAFEYQEPQGTDGFVGHNFFATHIVCIDFQSNRVLVRAR
jgi:hypothetical protein